jgi:hypothetical protein
MLVAAAESSNPLAAVVLAVAAAAAAGGAARGNICKLGEEKVATPTSVLGSQSIAAQALTTTQPREQLAPSA